MQRKPGYPVANCNIKMPDSVPLLEAVPCDDDGDQQQRRQQLINFGHTQWGFNNWSWTVNKQDLDFVDFAGGKYSVGVAAFVSVSVKTLDIRRENVGYASCAAPLKGAAIHQARKCAVTNALRETLLSFGGSVAAELLDALEAQRAQASPDPLPENNPNVANKPESKNTLAKNVIRKDMVDTNPVNIRHPPPAIKNVQNPPVAKALPMPASMASMQPSMPPSISNVQPSMPPSISSVQPSMPPSISSVQPSMPASMSSMPASMPVARPPAPRPNSNDHVDPEEEARAERKRRQRQAQEEFRLKQLMRQKTEEQELGSGSIDRQLLELPTPDSAGSGLKRKSPAAGPSERRIDSDRVDLSKVFCYYNV